MNKYTHRMACCLMAALALQACDDKDEPEKPADNDKVTVTIVTEVETRAALTTLFRNGDNMNVYAKTHNHPKAADLVENIRATFRDGSWSMTPEVKLAKGEKAFICAVAPYVEGISDLTAIPIDITKQQDILYSGGFTPVTHNTCQAKIAMKHALSMATYNISSRNYSGKGVLQSIRIAGDVVYTKGTMDVESGKTAGVEKGGLTLECNKPVSANGWDKDLPGIWVIPFSTEKSEVTIQAKIDGKEYNTKFPVIEMKKGTRYIFRLVLTDMGLELMPDQTVVVPLDQNTDRMEDLKGHGILQITHTGNTSTLPIFIGEGVFGFISWGDDTSESYSPKASHIYTGRGSRKISIETWNSTGFELSNLTDVEAIDLTRY